MPMPTGPKPRLITGHLAEFRADRLGFFTHCARTYGDVVPLRVVRYRVLLISRPDLIEEVLVTKAKNFVKHFGLRMYMPILGNGLVTSEGDFWRQQRKLSAPAFHGGRMAAYAGEIIDSVKRVVHSWKAQERAAGGAVIRDIHDDAMRLMLEITCRTLFGADLCPEPNAIGRAMEEALLAIDTRFRRVIPVPDWFPLPSTLRLRRAVRTIDTAVAVVIEHHRASGHGVASTDLLSTLLRASDDRGSAMTDGQLKDEVRTLLLAGHETTALTLTYSLYLLARNPQCQAKLQAELSAVIGGGEAPTPDDLPKLVYAHRVIAESLRLYPPADVLGREAIADCSVGGFKITRGTNIFMSTWVLHHDPRYFAEPESFDPDRWTDEFERSLPRFAYFPFGGGPRFCIGQTLATAEAVLTLATLCHHFQFDSDPAFKLQLWPSITLRPRAGVRLIVSDRQSDRPVSD